MEIYIEFGFNQIYSEKEYIVTFSHLVMLKLFLSVVAIFDF